MPSFIRTDKDEADWLRAKSIISRQYPDVKEGSEQFWRLVNHVFHSINGRKVGEGKAPEDVLRRI